MEKYVLTQDLVTGNELIDSEHRFLTKSIPFWMHAQKEREEKISQVWENFLLNM